MPPPPSHIETLTDMLHWRAEQHPKDCALTFLRDGDTDEHSWSYAELDRHSRAIAARLQTEMQPQDRALMLFNSGLEFLGSFFGCLYAGVIAVPAYPPQNLQTVSRVLSIFEDAKPRFVLTTSDILDAAKALWEKFPALKAATWIATDKVTESLASEWRRPALTGDSLAFLQYTSGSTSTPKGVMVMHRNLMANEEMIRVGMGVDDEAILCGWLPLYHDMGLIGISLQALYSGRRAVLMSPWAFLQRPLRWVAAMSRYRATWTGGPNFSYELCVRKVKPEQIEKLDLRAWKVAFNGAEPVRAETLERFAKAFAPAGLRREALYPCYGLAETTLFVTGGIVQEPCRTFTVDAKELERNRAIPAEPGTPNARTLVSCGKTWGSETLRIVDPEKFTPCDPGQIGEIWVAGPHIAQGYWHRDKETAETFQARIQGTDEGPFLRTGDLGFVLEGELYVTGRIKDLIIINGRNHYPSDIELTVEKVHEAFRPGCTVAFSVDRDNEERLVILAEIHSRYLQPEGGAPAQALDPQQLLQEVRQGISTHHSVDVYDLVLLQPGEVQKTSSGKVQRRACRARYLGNSLKRVPA
jgi:acyl-CoA synthetase (AMP-forming)/AMP-acid ligase II